MKLNIKDRLIASTLALILFMELVDSSALNTVLPQISTSLSVNVISLKVSITIYLLTLGLFMPASSWVSDRLGAKNTLILSVSGFIISSMLCGTSSSLFELIIFRALQGFCGAFTVPVSRLAMARIFKGRRLYAISLFASIASIGPMLGPLVGGALATFLSWRYIFFINVPIGIITIYSLIKFLPKDNHTKEKTQFDWLGFLIVGTAIASFMFVLDTLIYSNIYYQFKFFALTLSILLSVVYIIYSLNKRTPAIIDLAIFKFKSFTYFIIISASARIISSGIVFMLPLYLQVKQNYTPLQSGLVLVSFVVSSWISRMFVKNILTRFKLYKTLLTCLIIVMIDYIFASWIVMHYSLALMVLILVIYGGAFGLFITTINTVIYNSITDDKMISTANTINSMVVQLSTAFSVAWISFVLTYASGINNIVLNSVITLKAFEVVFICFSVSYALIILFTIYAKPKNIHKIELN